MMRTILKRHMLGLAAILAVWSAPAGAQTPSIEVDYYTPQYYLDRLVFFDENGNPIYYESDTAYAVPTDYDGYNNLVSYFQQNEANYARWFQEVGYQNLEYRMPLAHGGYQPVYYSGYPIFYNDAGQPIYYVDGSVAYVPSSDPGYAGWVRYYQLHRGLYLRWYQARGRYFHWYRTPIGTSYYQPLYYEGYPVYYSDAGAPYYYSGGQSVYIPASYGLYNTYVSHYRTHRVHYVRWYSSTGQRYRDYRQPVHFRGQRTAVVNAPRAVRGRAVNRTFVARPVAERRAIVRPGIVRPGPAGGPPPNVHHRPGVVRPSPGGPPVVVQPQPSPVHRPRPVYQPQPGHPPVVAQPRPVPHPTGASHAVDCNANPNHPLCRRATRRPPPQPQPAPQVKGRPVRRTH
jgi:hypothetical protein